MRTNPHVIRSFCTVADDIRRHYQKLEREEWEEAKLTTRAAEIAAEHNEHITEFRIAAYIEETGCERDYAINELAHDVAESERDKYGWE